MGTEELVLASQLNALIVALHRRGVLPATAVVEQMREVIPLQSEHREVLETAAQHVQRLADALERFEPQRPNATWQNHGN
jgi:hypothetical protein